MFRGCSLCDCMGPSAVVGWLPWAVWQAWLAPDPAGCQALPCGVGVYTYIPHLFIHSSVDGHLGCLHILTTVNIVAVNIVVRVSFWISVFFGGDIYTEMRLLGHMVLLVFWETAILFSAVDTPIYILTSSVWEFPFLAILVNVCYW